MLTKRSILGTLFIIVILFLLAVINPISIIIDRSSGPEELTWGHMGAVFISTNCDFVLNVEYQIGDFQVTAINYERNFVLSSPFGGAFCWYYVSAQSIPTGAKTAQFFRVHG